MSEGKTLQVLLGDYPVTRRLRRGELRGSGFDLAFADIVPPNNGFKRVVRDLGFDIAELAIVTFLLAHAHGRPLRLLPVVVMARPQFPYLVRHRERPDLLPSRLAGKRIAIRSYSVTTTTWIRGELMDRHGVDPASVTWVTFEEAHVAEFRDPPNVVRAAAGRTAVDMLLDGSVDAAIIGDVRAADPRIVPLYADPAAEDAAWRSRHGGIMINHMVVVTEALLRRDPQAVQDFYRLLGESRAQSGLSAEELSFLPFGLVENRHNIELAIDSSWRQGLLPRRPSVDELFDEVTRAL